MTATFGDVTTEYLALRESAGFIEGVHDVVWVAGDDHITFLDGLLSQSIVDIAVGAAAPSLLLAPQGKLRATLWVLRGEDRVALVADSGRGSIVIDDLTRFKLRVDVDIWPEEKPVVDVWGPEAPRALSQLGIDSPEVPGWLTIGDRSVAALPFSRVSLARYVLVGIDLKDLRDLGLQQSGSLAAAAVRIETGEPVMGIDIDERTIPQEADVVEAAVDFTKGCYLGQELVARIESRGRVNRHLRGLLVSANVLPPVGAEIIGPKGVAGSLTSVGESLELRTPVALALIRRELDPGDVVEIRWPEGTVAATVAELPLDKSL